MNIVKKRIIIGEDEPLILEHLKSTLKKFGYEVVGSGTTEQEIMEVLRSVEADLILMDINIGGNFEGIGIGAFIRDHIHRPFIYVTAHSDPETLRKALHTQPSSYVVKPFKATDIYTAVELALHSVELERKAAEGDRPNRDILFVNVRGSIVKVIVKDIIYAKAEGNYTMLYLLNGKYLLRGNLTEIIDNYLNSEFFRIHKSFAVNVSKVNAVNQSSVVLEGQDVPLGRTFRQSLLEKLGKG